MKPAAIRRELANLRRTAQADGALPPALPEPERLQVRPLAGRLGESARWRSGRASPFALCGITRRWDYSDRRTGMAPDSASTARATCSAFSKSDR